MSDTKKAKSKTTMAKPSPRSFIPGKDAERLTIKEIRFVEEYCTDFNATQAAIRAGYSKKTASSIGNENLRKPKIDKLIQHRKMELQVTTGVTAENVIKELAKIAFFDSRHLFDENHAIKPMSELHENTSACITNLEVEELHAGYGDDRVHIGRLKKVKVADKVAALEKLGKHLGILTEKYEDVTKNPKTINVINMTPEQAAQAYKEALKPKK